MPRLVCQHQIEFTPEQLAHARKIAAPRSAPHREVLRAKLTLIVAEQPTISHSQAEQVIGLHEATVYEWHRRWARAGWSLQDAPRSGDYTPEETTLVKAVGCERPAEPGRPLSRLSVFDVCRQVRQQGCRLS